MTQKGDRAFSLAVHAAGLFVLVLLGSIIVLLFQGGLPAFRAFGPGFLFSSVWNPVTEKFGALVSVYGTIVSSVLALAMAVPLAFGVAFFLTELAPSWLRRPVGTAVELLAAVPSIIYGMWGFFVLGWKQPSATCPDWPTSSARRRATAASSSPRSCSPS